MSDSIATYPKPADAAAVHLTPWPVWALLALAAGLAVLGFYTGLELMVGSWFTSEEYSHGMLIPLIAAFLVWQQKDRLERLEFTGSWAGAVIVAGGMLLLALGQLAALYILQQYALLVTIYGLVLALTGWQVIRRLWVPLLILLFMIPLPQFLLQNVSAQLQLISSQIGVWFIRLFGISVFVEGNVIDLGSYRLQVAEACDGLRYLFPLMTLGFIMAYFYRASMWKRVVLFLSSIPVTILMNSFRIGTIGVMVEHWGVKMAEGFLHDFQGWAVFMASGGLLLAEMALLSFIGANRRPWRELFALDFPAPTPKSSLRATRPMPVPLIASVAVLAIGALALKLTPQRAELIPERTPFASFPTQISGWSGRHTRMEQVYLDALKLDDYVMGDFVRNQRDPVNFYVAWYNSQSAGQSAHSPRSCLPGGGWQIVSLDQRELNGVRVGGRALRTNRALIAYGDQQQVVYYWFQQRGRIVTNEYLVKWYLFWDALTRRRTDGALVRLIAPLRKGESVAAVDARLSEFATAAARELGRFVPD